MSRPLPRSEWFGTMTPEQQRRVDEGEARIRQKRAAAEYQPIMERRGVIAERRTMLVIDPDGSSEETREATGEINCARCMHIGDFNAEHQRGWCMWLRHMVSTWHPALCKAFEASA